MASFAKQWDQHLVWEFGVDAVIVAEEVQAFAADAEQAEELLRDLMKLLELAPSAASELRSFRAQPLALARLLSVARCSRYGFNLILRDSRRFWDILQTQVFREVIERDELLKRAQAAVAPYRQEARQVAALLRFYQYQVLRIMIGDLSEVLGFEATVRELSDLADAVVQVALDIAIQHYRERFGEAGAGFCVLGLGKLGGRELNYSSDLDLIFISGGNGHTTGGANSIDHDEYFRRLGKYLIGILDEPTDGGRLFRIDMRLRPEGASGELVLSRRTAVDYYYTKGRAWERQAMIKARPIAGDLALGERLLEDLRPWVFPREQSLDQMHSSREMRRRIEERADSEDVKTGVGGIRDIEFLVQSFQLNYGGLNPELRHRSTLPALRSLGDLRLIRRSEARLLEKHYIALRHVEHRLQLWEARQLHAVPDSRAERLHLARRCGCDPDDPLADFERQLGRARREVRELAEHYYLTATEQEDALFCLLTTEQPDTALIQRSLGEVGFRNPERAARILRDLASEPFFVLSEQRTERCFLAILPHFLDLLADSPNADVTLTEFARLVQAVGGRSYFYEEMAKHPDRFQALVHLAGWATYLVAYLERFPGLIDDLMEHAEGLVHWTAAGLHEAQRSLTSSGTARFDFAQNLAYLQARELVHIAWVDLQGEQPERIGQALSELASAVFGLCLDQVLQDLDQKWGRPMTDGKRKRFAVLGLGKLGGKELTYASDMDVIFVCDPGGSCSRKARDADYYWERLAGRCMGLLGEKKIYEIDPRLRPWGDQGPLVVSLPMLEKYWSADRDLWERMANTRVSVLAGDVDLGREAVAIIHRSALGAPLPCEAAHQVWHMRRRLEKSVAGRDHLKRGSGGYVDIEFAVQFRCLHATPEQIPPGLSTQAALARLQALGQINAEQATNMRESLQLLRRIETRMRLATGRAISSIPTDADGRLRIARQSGYDSVAALDEALYQARERARHCAEQLIR